MLPRDVKAGIDRYVDTGCPTGGFLRAVLSNDLFDAVGRAYESNQHCLVDICAYLYNCTPILCHGSPQRVEEWLKLHREKPEFAHEAAASDRERRAHYYD